MSIWFWKITILIRADEMRRNSTLHEDQVRQTLSKYLKVDALMQLTMRKPWKAASARNAVVELLVLLRLTNLIQYAEWERSLIDVRISIATRRFWAYLIKRFVHTPQPHKELLWSYPESEYGYQLKLWLLERTPAEAVSNRDGQFIVFIEDTLDPHDPEMIPYRRAAHAAKKHVA